MKGYGGPSGSNETGNMVYEQVAQPIAYSFDSLASNSMKSSNPHSGCREVETSKTIDTTTPEPSKNQGGIAIAQPQYFESHPNDSRVTGPHDVGNTVSAWYGTGGGNTPIVSQPIAVDTYNYTTNEHTTQTIGSSASDVNHYGAVLQTMAIRRLTPKECERLQGFPDDWTKIPYRNKPADQCPDGPRYKACGNSMAVPVMRWIGQRIEYVESLMKDL
jgi:site-specific DNA-cytosine methylase